jgi:alpha-amylase
MAAHRSWLGNDKVYLMDLNQDNDQVRNTLLNWAPKYVAEYGIDGFRIDATKHMTRAWQHDFCAAAGVYCIGEAYNDDRAGAGKYQGEGGIDGVLGFGTFDTGSE